VRLSLAHLMCVVPGAMCKVWSRVRGGRHDGYCSSLVCSTCGPLFCASSATLCTRPMAKQVQVPVPSTLLVACFPTPTPTLTLSPGNRFHVILQVVFVFGAHSVPQLMGPLHALPLRRFFGHTEPSLQCPSVQVSKCKTCPP
jgi:hypothetical protein